MGNIFDERRDSELVQARDKMSLKAAPPPAPPAPKKSEQPAPPEAPAPEGQPREGTQQAPPPPLQTSIPFVPPVGYGVVPSSALSFDKQRDWFQAQEQAVMDSNVQAILPLVQQQTFTNPYTDQTMNSGEAAIRARQWQDQFNGNLQREWDSYVTYSNHGVNPATQFDGTGNPVRRASETEIRQGLNGLTSRLGASLKAATDNENWFGRVVNGAMNTVMFGTRAVQDLTSIGAATILDAPGVNQLGDKVAEYLFQGDPNAAKQHERWIRQQKMIWDKGDVGQRGERRQQILQQAPVSNTVSDFDDNLLGKVFYTLSLPENLVMGAVYEFSDMFLRARGQDPGINTGGRVARALYGQDLSILNRASNEKYLGWMEPEGTRPGDMTGNIFWDAPENFQQTMGMIGLVPDDPRQKQNQLRWLHWAMQAAPTVAVSMFVDPPIDVAIGAISRWRKGSEVAQETLETAATVPGKLPTVTPNAAVPTTPGRGISETSTFVDTPTLPGIDEVSTVIETPTISIPSSTGTTLPLPTPEVPYTTVKGKPSVVTPNEDTAEVIASTLTPGVPARPIDPVEITLVRRSEEDLARMGNRFGVKPDTVVLTPAELRMLQRGDSNAWARWGKPVSPYIETVDSINLPTGQTVPIGDVYPRALGLPELPRGEELVQRLEGAVSEGLDLDQAITAARTPEDLGALLAQKEVNNRMQAMLRDSIPPETAWAENVHLLPPSLNPPGVQAPEVIDAGTQYIETVLRLEDTAANMKALDIQFDSLRTVDDYIDSRLSSLPNAGRQDFQDIQATRGMYGLDDMSDAPLTQEVPSTFDDVALEQRLGELEMQKADIEVQQRELDNPLLAKSKELIEGQRVKRGASEWNPDAIEAQQAKLESLYEKGAPDRVLEREEAKLMKMQAQDPYILDSLEEKLDLLNDTDIDTDTLSKVYTDVNRMLTKEFNQLEYEKMISDLQEMIDKSGTRQSANLKPQLDAVNQEMENIQEMRPMPPREVQPEEIPAPIGYKSWAEYEAFQSSAFDKTMREARGEVQPDLPVYDSRVTSVLSQIQTSMEEVGRAIDKAPLGERGELQAVKDWLERTLDHVHARPNQSLSIIDEIEDAVRTRDIGKMEQVWNKLQTKEEVPLNKRPPIRSNTAPSKVVEIPKDALTSTSEDGTIMFLDPKTGDWVDSGMKEDFNEAMRRQDKLAKEEEALSLSGKAPAKMNDDYFTQLEARQQKERQARLGNKLITDPAELDLISRIKAEYPDQSARVYLADIREKFPEVTDDLLTRMEKDGHASLQTFNDPLEVNPRHTAAAVQWGGEPRYFMYLKDVKEVPGSVVPPVTPKAKAEPSLVDMANSDPVLLDLERQIKKHVADHKVAQEQLHSELVAKGVPPLDASDTPEFRRLSANESYDRLSIWEKQIDREVELLGKADNYPVSRQVTIAKSTLSEYGDVLSPKQKTALEDMISKYEGQLTPKQKAATKTNSKYPTMPSNAELPVAQIGDDYWQHGTRSQGDIRTWVPQNGSGAHELGLGVYFTQNRLVAEAAATKFNLRNVPMNINADFSAPPHINTVSTVNIQTVLDMNHLLSKSEFDNVFGGAFLHVMDNDPAQVNAFWQKFKTKYNGELGYLYDAYAEHLAETVGHADGLLIRTFQQQMFDVLQKYDAGVFTGKNGESMLVVYNPARLVNVNVEDLRRGVNTDVTPPTPKTPEPVTAQPTPGTVDVTAQTVDPTVPPAESPGFKFNKKPEMYNAMDDLSTVGDDVATMGTRLGDDMPDVDPYSVMDIDSGLDEVDEMVEALEAQRYLDHYTAQVVGSDAQQVRHLESTQELVQYEQQRVAEAMGEEFTRHSEDLESLLETESSLREFSRAKTEKLITEYDTATEASSAFTRATTQSSETDLVAEAMRKNKQFRKFRNKLEKKLDSLHKKLGKVGINSKAHEQLLAEIDDLTKKVADIDSGFSHQIRVMKALAGRNPATGMDWQKMTEFQRLADLQNLNPKWWDAKGEWLARSAFEKARNRVQQFAARYIDSALGGDVGAVRDQLFNLKRVGQGQFAAMLADIEASSRIKGTWKNAQEYLKSSGVKIPQRQVHELLSELMELQASPYLMDEAFANTQVAKFLQAKLAETYRLGMSFGLSQVQLDDLSGIVREIPQVYHEVRDLAQKMGINFGDEITLGYLPRELKETVMFMIGEHGVKHTSDAADNFRKSRTLFHYVPEDSMLMEQVLDTVNSKWRETLNVQTFDELIGREGDSKLLAALNGILTDDDLDMLNEMGVLRKIPFTQVESAKFIAQKYDLPFNHLTRIYMSDPAEAFQLYKKGLQDKAAKSGIANGLIGSIGEMAWHRTPNSPAPNGWVKLTDLGLQGYIPSDFAEYAQDLFVHPFVADELHAMYHIQTSPGILSMVGDVANLVYKYTAGSMLATPRWLTMQVLGNLSNVVKRGINPQLFFESVYKNFRFFNDPEELIKALRTSKEFMGGAYSQQEMWNLGIKLGILDVDAQVYGSATGVAGFNPGHMMSGAKESIDEFFHYLQKGGYHREYAEGFKVSHDPILHGVISRLIAGSNEVLDRSIYQLLDMGNKVTDNALKFALFQAVTKDDPGWVRHIPGFNPRVFNNLPHFTDPVKAAEWVRNASYTFDQVGTNENLMRYIMPFWTFQRLSFMETARWIAANPAKFSGYVHIVSATQNNFEEEDSAAWEALMGSGWMAESMPIPVKIPADQSASGEDEYYVYPLATLSPSAGALGLPGKLAGMFGFDIRGQEPSPKDSRGNKYAGSPQNFAEWMRQEGSPFARTILSVFDPSFLDPFSTKTEGTVEERTNYPLGLSRTGWAYTKLWAPWVSTLVKLSPESVKGRPARVNPRTGAFEEGTPDFLGNVPTTLTGGNIYGNRGFFEGFMQNVGLAPVSFDMLLQQGFSMTEIKSQLYALEKDAKRIHSLLRNPTPGYKKEDLERQLSELQVISLHLRSQYDIYREWRRLNDLPHPRALKQIEQANLKVDKLLPESERQRIYQENWERYRRQFQ